MLELTDADFAENVFIFEPIYNLTENDGVEDTLVSLYIPYYITFELSSRFRLMAANNPQPVRALIAYCLSRNYMIAIPVISDYHWQVLGFDKTKSVHDFNFHYGGYFKIKIKSREPTIFELMKLKLAGQIGQ